MTYDRYATPTSTGLLVPSAWEVINVRCDALRLSWTQQLGRPVTVFSIHHFSGARPPESAPKVIRRRPAGASAAQPSRASQSAQSNLGRETSTLARPRIVCRVCQEASKSKAVPPLTPGWGHRGDSCHAPVIPTRQSRVVCSLDAGSGQCCWRCDATSSGRTLSKEAQSRIQRFAPSLQP